MKLSPSSHGGIEVEYATGMVVFFYASTPVAARLGPRGPILVCIDLVDAQSRSRARAWIAEQNSLGKIKVTFKILKRMVELC